LGAAATGIVVQVRDKENQEACKGGACIGDPSAVPINQDGLVYANAALWGVGIAGAAAGAVMLVLSRRAREAPKVVLAPQVAPSGGGIGFFGRF